jgi:hypothetical protein
VISYDRPLTREEAQAVWDILVERANVYPVGGLHDDFMFHQTREWVPEYRFQGVLGYGGKFYREHDRVGRVAMYFEDENPARRLIVDQINKVLRDRF